MVMKLVDRDESLAFPLCFVSVTRKNGPKQHRPTQQVNLSQPRHKMVVVDRTLSEAKSKEFLPKPHFDSSFDQEKK